MDGLEFVITAALIGAAAWLGWSIHAARSRRQLAALTAELRVANSDLRQSVSDLAAAREQIAALDNRLTQAGRDRSRFIDDLAIKLRTQLTLLSGYSELLLTGAYGELTAKQLDRVTKLHRSVLTLNSLIAHMIDLNKIDAGRMALALDTLPLRRAIDGAASALADRRAQSGIDLQLDIAPNLPPVRGDEDRLRQIFTELIENAIKFTPAPADAAPAPTITVRARLVRVVNGRADDFPLPVAGWLAEGDWLIAAVSDPGIGIASGEQARIFDEFSQLNPETYEGAGLGLAIARRLVELHQGSIWVKSQPEQGSTFFVALRPAGTARPRS